ncbi:YkvA family protein [Microvirga roseola]|uniref:YkvA family protein n=1 Tax=Microvirga roseola TaxID=2883126 RepID=UPI001E3ED531|nr:YkvA family protein [Microvirga roseola]
MSEGRSRGLLARMKDWARTIRADVIALYLAARHPLVPWYAKLVAGLVAAYALSPIDLIPDFIPVLGYLDDIILVPLGILLAVRLVPRDLMSELRAEAQRIAERPVSRTGALLILALWILAAGLLLWVFWPRQAA